MKKRLCLAVLLILAALCLLCACDKEPVDPTPTPTPGSEPVERVAHFYNGERLLMSVPFTYLEELEMPPAPDMGGAAFVGWRYEVGGEQKLCAAGVAPESVNAEGDLKFYALGIHISATMAVVPSLTEEAFTFEASINGDDMRALTAVLGAENVKAGLLVAPYAGVTGPEREFTLECGAPGLVDHKGAPFTAAEGNYLLTGSTGVIAEDQLLEKFAARVYLTYIFMGYAVTVYGDYYSLMHTTSLFGASALAFEDMVTAADENYAHAIQTAEGTRYSRYTAAEREVLRARLDRAVYVDTANGRVENKYSLNNVDFYDYKYYVSPYEVTLVSDELVEGARTFVVVGREGADHATIDAYFVGGSYRPPKADEWHEDGLYIAVGSETH